MDLVRIVGAGVAGCAAAATALELGYRVEVYEAGPGGPLPGALRSPDLNRASGATEWWWPADYPAGRGVGGGSAVNGMVVQRPATSNAAVDWAWEAMQPVPAEPGALGSTILSAAGAAGEVAMLSVHDGFRRTAADVWLGAHDHLTVLTDGEATAGQVQRWVEQGDRVLVAAGAMRSAALVSAEPLPVLDHRSAVVGFEFPSVPTATDQPAATVLIRSGDAQLLLLETTATPNRAALVVSAMVTDPAGSVLEAGIAYALGLLALIGVSGEVESSPAPVSHACCTLTGIDTIAPVVDASTLPALPNVNPMLTVAAHARRQTLAQLKT